MKRLAIVGSSVLTPHQAVTAWYIIEGLISVYWPEEIVSGGASGIDQAAEDCAFTNGYVRENPDGSQPVKWFRAFEPDVRAWDPPYGQKGFKQRNLEIVSVLERGDQLWRIAKHEGQTTYGSGWTADRAEERLGAANVHRVYL